MERQPIREELHRRIAQRDQRLAGRITNAMEMVGYPLIFVGGTLVFGSGFYEVNGNLSKELGNILRSSGLIIGVLGTITALAGTEINRRTTWKEYVGLAGTSRNLILKKN